MTVLSGIGHVCNQLEIKQANGSAGWASHILRLRTIKKQLNCETSLPQISGISFGRICDDRLFRVKGVPMEQL